MAVFIKEEKIQTNERREVVNITPLLEEIVMESGIQKGIVLVFVPHATAALFANEDEPNIRKDHMDFFEKLAPENGNYEHNKIDNNADAHLLSSIFKQFYIFPIKDGKVVRGTWQELFLAEFDGPRIRKVVFVVLGE